MEGNSKIDILMIPVAAVIRKHVKNRDAFTEIYNRAYEAILISMDAKAKLEKLQAQNEELKAIVQYLVECPYYIDEATVTKAGIDAFPDQVVGNLSFKLTWMRRARRALEEADA